MRLGDVSFIARVRIGLVPVVEDDFGVGVVSVCAEAAYVGFSPVNSNQLPGAARTIAKSPKDRAR